MNNGFIIKLREVGCGKTYYLGSSVGFACYFCLVSDREYVEETLRKRDGRAGWVG